jgi:hypothetical protein
MLPPLVSRVTIGDLSVIHEESNTIYPFIYIRISFKSELLL